MASTRDVLDRYLDRFRRGDLESLLADYAPDVVYFAPDGPVRGVDALRRRFQSMVPGFAAPGATFELRHAAVDGETAFILWSGETPDASWEIGAETLVVRDGRIVAQSFTGRAVPKPRET